MKIQRMDHIGVVVDDLEAAKTFFLDLGLELEGEAELGGELVDRLIGLESVKSAIVFLRTADGQTYLELIKYHSPIDADGVRPSASNTLGMRHIAFAVEDLEGIVAGLKARGAEFFSEIQNYEGIYKLCYVRGPEGIILELAERVKGHRP